MFKFCLIFVLFLRREFFYIEDILIRNLMDLFYFGGFFIIFLILYMFLVIYKKRLFVSIVIKVLYFI